MKTEKQKLNFLIAVLKDLHCIHFQNGCECIDPPTHSHFNHPGRHAGYCPIYLENHIAKVLKKVGAKS